MSARPTILLDLCRVADLLERVNALELRLALIRAEVESMRHDYPASFHLIAPLGRVLELASGDRP